ncbi:MAG: hypothetical protein IT160_17175 [Bryobacterales bacterium]|nr:hypothetical protein [Bryobacterales bacterium]
MLRITLHDQPEALTLQLEGQLAAAWVAELRRSWKTTASVRGNRRLMVDLTSVTYVDQEGTRLLETLHRQGVEFLSAGPMMRALVHKITGGKQGYQETGHPAPHRRPRRQVRSFAFTLCALLLAGLPLAGELRLTLKQAADREPRLNLQALVAKLELADRGEQSRIVRSALLPQAGMDVSAAHRSE